MYQNNIYSFSFFHSINTTLGSRLVEIAISIAGHLFRRDDYSFNSTTLSFSENKRWKILSFNRSLFFGRYDCPTRVNQQPFAFPNLSNIV